ncbi:hypothetical protein [Pseudomonas jilinensis]|uniref:hypothetical protein n=1 Tax=Pseudomonas jilinensis TaxID=2078689 RepID=UPI001034AD49|nr:hypothetical protein [Pseudomonas jilinensis]
MDEHLKRQIESLKPSIDDAPTRVRKQKNKSPIGISTILAISLIGGIIYMGDRNGWAGHLKRQIAPPTAGLKQEPAPVQPEQIAAQVPSKPSTNQPTAEEIFWQNVERDRQAQAKQGERKTVFNDSNYAPRTNINTIQAPRQTEAAAPRQSQRLPQGLNGRSSTIAMPWKDARGRTTYWRTSFSYQNSQIDNSSFCSNYRAGSIEYRTCRKAAKEWLKGECLSNSTRISTEWRRMYCHAEGAFIH